MTACHWLWFALGVVVFGGLAFALGLILGMAAECEDEKTDQARAGRGS